MQVRLEGLPRLSSRTDSQLQKSSGDHSWKKMKLLMRKLACIAVSKGSCVVRVDLVKLNHY